jgi:hypothetical protein
MVRLKSQQVFAGIEPLVGVGMLPLLDAGEASAPRLWLACEMHISK